MTDSAMIALLGATGSGKTEIALQLSLDAAAKGHRTCLIDLDIVNPYFRSGSRKGVLEAAGVDVIMPNYAMTTVDVPSLPGGVIRAAMGTYDRMFIDVGGDEAGAVAMGGYADAFAEKGGVALFVLNPFRPMSGSAKDILLLMERVQARARLAASGLINNANIGYLTTADEVIGGQAIVEEAARALGLPVMLACTREAAANLPEGFPAPDILLTPRLRPDWLDDA